MQHNQTDHEGQPNRPARFEVALALAGLALVMAVGIGALARPAAATTPQAADAPTAQAPRAASATPARRPATPWPAPAANAVAPTPAATRSPPPTSAPAPSATPAPPPAATPTAQPAFILHTVVKGDRLYNLAKQYHVSMDAILAANRIENPRSLVIGEVIRIPRSDLAP